MKRRAVLILLLIVAGAIVNVAVAWACATWSHPLHSGLPDEVAEAMAWLRARDSSLDESRVFWVDSKRSWGADSIAILVVPSGKVDADTLYTVSRKVVGWPRRSLARVGKGSLHTTNIAADHHAFANFLPLRPIWPGFAINTVFYAAMLWLLFAAPFALRRRRRIKRGLCPKCAYPVGTNAVCTECGAAVRR